MQNESTVNIEEIYDDLKFKNRKVFHEIFQKEPESCCFCISCALFDCCSKYEYRNAYEQRDVISDDELLKEWVFVCLAEHRQRKPRKIIPYYISAEYNVSEASTSNDLSITGRFIFVRAARDKLELRALAEEPARPPKNMDGNVEEHYLRVRTHFEASTHRFDDPICNVSKKNRVRMCASVLSSSYFAKFNIKFFPDIKYVTNVCDKNKVSFQTNNAIEKLEQGRALHFEEWMISCRAIKIDGDARIEMNINDAIIVEYLISTAYESNKVFVYRRDESTDRIFLENLSTHVNINLEDF